MAKVTRERATIDGRQVTILRRGKFHSTIRDQHGYVHEVKTRSLERIREDEPEASFTFQDE